MKYNSYTADYFQINFNLSKVETFQNHKKKRYSKMKQTIHPIWLAITFTSRIVTVKTTFHCVKSVQIQSYSD